MCVHTGLIDRGAWNACVPRLDGPMLSAGVSCQNSPVVGVLKVTAFFGDAESDPHIEAFPGGNQVDWARLLPFNLNAGQLETLLHRSHHAMAYVGLVAMDTIADPQGLVHAFLLWAGFGRDMAVLGDLWVVYILPAGECTALSRSAWWLSAWCWTARPVVQQGMVPKGRAYAQLTVLEVRFFHMLVQVVVHVSGSVSRRQRYIGVRNCRADSKGGRSLWRLQHLLRDQHCRRSFTVGALRSGSS